MAIMTMPGKVGYDVLGILFLEVTRTEIILGFVNDYQGVVRNILVKTTDRVRVLMVLAIFIVHTT
jgi:hypothetical protein